MSDALHVIGFSGGKDSTAMALRLAAVEPRDYLLVCTPTGDELPGWHEHMRCTAAKVGKLQIVTCGRSLSRLIDEQNSLPNFRQRWCTRILKIEPYRAWLARMAAAHGRVVSYVGLRADEQGRAGGAFEDIPGVEMRFPLREWGWELADVWLFLEQRGITVPERTDCARCYYQSLGDWWRLWKLHADLYADAEAQEARISAHRGRPITFRSPTKGDNWPASLEGLRHEFERGRVPRSAPRQTDLFRAAGTCRVCSL